MFHGCVGCVKCSLMIFTKTYIDWWSMVRCWCSLSRFSQQSNCASSLSGGDTTEPSFVTPLPSQLRLCNNILSILYERVWSWELSSSNESYLWLSHSQNLPSLPDWQLVKEQQPLCNKQLWPLPFFSLSTPLRRQSCCRSSRSSKFHMKWLDSPRPPFSNNFVQIKMDGTWIKAPEEPATNTFSFFQARTRVNDHRCDDVDNSKSQPIEKRDFWVTGRMRWVTCSLASDALKLIT